jgi:AcrR family transcriptional regulator
MLDAAEAVMEKHGVEGLTVRRVAAAAGLSPANVYRRLRNKEALIGAVFSRFSQQTAQELAHDIDPAQIRPIGIRVFARKNIAAMIGGFRHRTALIRAAVLYSQRHPNAPFVKEKTELEIRGFRRMVGVFLLWRDEIHHPDPEYAVGNAMVLVALALRELIIFDNARMFEQIVPVDDDHLRQELPRVFLRYLGVEDE